MEDVNQKHWKVSKHCELWAKNTFDEWWVFQSFNTQKSIIDLFENEESIKDLVDVLFSFVLQVAKKDSNQYCFIFKFLIFAFYFSYLQKIEFSFCFLFMLFANKVN